MPMKVQMAYDGVSAKAISPVPPRTYKGALKSFNASTRTVSTAFYRRKNL